MSGADTQVTTRSVRALTVSKMCRVLRPSRSGERIARARIDFGPPARGAPAPGQRTVEMVLGASVGGNRIKHDNNMGAVL